MVSRDPGGELSRPLSPRPSPAARARNGPSVLDLVRLSEPPVFPPGGEELYRQIARAVELDSNCIVLDAACGRGLSTEFLANNYGVEAHGLDPDPLLIEEAEARARGSPRGELLHYQAASLDDLPYKDGVFDVAIGEVALAATVSPAAAVHELARVTRPRGAVVLIQLTWTGHVEENRREVLVEHLGAHPLLLVEWKQHLRDAGVVDLHVEDWSDSPSPFRPSIRRPFHDIAEIFSLRQKLSILRRALKRWGWKGLRGAVLREQEIHSILTRQRLLGLTLIRGTKWE